MLIFAIYTILNGYIQLFSKILLTYHTCCVSISGKLSVRLKRFLGINRHLWYLFWIRSQNKQTWQRRTTFNKSLLVWKRAKWQTVCSYVALSNCNVIPAVLIFFRKACFVVRVCVCVCVSATRRWYANEVVFCCCIFFAAIYIVVQFGK